MGPVFWGPFIYSCVRPSQGVDSAQQNAERGNAKSFCANVLETTAHQHAKCVGGASVATVECPPSDAVLPRFNAIEL